MRFDPFLSMFSNMSGRWVWVWKNGRQCLQPITILKWLNTVLQAVSGTSCDGAFSIRQTNMAAKKTMVHIYSLKFCDIWQNFYFYCILNNENFKMEVEQTNFVTHLIITVQLYYWLSKNPSVKIWSSKFQMVMINQSKLCTSL